MNSDFEPKPDQPPLTYLFKVWWIAPPKQDPPFPDIHLSQTSYSSPKQDPPLPDILQLS